MTTNMISSNGYYYDPTTKQFVCQGNTATNNYANASIYGSNTIAPTTDSLVYTAPTTTTAATTTTTNTTTSSTAADGKDDGKISFWDKVKSGVKGAVKGLVNGVKDTVTHPAKLALAVGAVALSIACPPVGVALAVAGGVMGTAQVVKGAVKASGAKTDAEAEQAYENIGSGVLQVGLSVAGAKAGLKACGETSEALSQSVGEAGGVLNKVKNVASSFKNDTVSSLEENTSLGKNISELGSVKEGIKQTWNDRASISDLKASGNKAIAQNMEDAAGNLQDAIKKYSTDAEGNVKNTKIADLENLDPNDANYLKTLNEKLDAIDKKDLTAAQKNEIKNLAKQTSKSTEKYNQALEKMANKRDEVLASDSYKNYMEKLETQLKKNDKYTDADIQQKLGEASKDYIDQHVQSGSAIKGATSNAKEWANSTIQKNAQKAADKAGITAEDATQSKIDITNAEIKQMEAKDGAIAKAQKTVEEKTANLKKAKTDKDKATAEQALKDANKALDDATDALSGKKSRLKAQKDLYNANQLATGNASLTQTASAMNKYVAPTVADHIEGNNATPVAATTPATQQVAQTPSINYDALNSYSNGVNGLDYSNVAKAQLNTLG